MTGNTIRRNLIIAVAACAIPAARRHSAADDSPKFNRDVRPIFAKHCFSCHGPDQANRQAGFRLDVKASATAKAESGRAPIVPGSLKQSELARRIEVNGEERMPPSPHSPLSASARRTLREWIKAGARFEKHWSFQAPRPMTPPRVRDDSWPRNPIDRFVLAKQERHGFRPSPEASRETLVRRVTLDLTGLPPTPAEVDAFLADRKSGAWERLVDRLMKTRAYAERRAQDWLDLARYADTRGFADDRMRNIWPWRDWVVRAIHQNIPFDQFTIEQLAGDMLPNATDEQRLATAFHRNAPQAKGMTYPVEEYRLKGVVDRVNVTGQVWLGLTLGCAECHDHKFDPITQRDYYSLFAIFNNVEHSGTGFGQGGPTMSYRQRSGETERLLAKRRRIEEQLQAARKESPVPQPGRDAKPLGRWSEHKVVARPERFSLTGDLTITARIRTAQPVADIVSKYDWRGKQRSYVFGIGGEADTNGIPGHLFCWISSQTDPYNGAELHGSFRINDRLPHDVSIEFKAGDSMRLIVDGVEDKSARLIGHVPKSIARSNRRLAIGSGYRGNPQPDAFRFEGDLDVRLFDKALGDALTLDKKSAAEISALQTSLQQIDQKLSSGENAVATVPIMKERSKDRDTYIHVRGNFLDPGDKVTPRVPLLFDVLAEKAPKNRLEFARWLVDGNNPLVARVVVNRLWQNYFGRGLVETSDDFGTQGALPTHPDLLDWLAAEFVASGWDRKHIHRLVVTSATYRQSSRARQISSPKSSSTELDSSHVELLLRMPRVRLPAEQIRDQALAVSGLLNRQAGGPPVFPVQPDGYWKQRALPGEWKNSEGADRFRRTIYTYWRRMALHPSLELLNAPAREGCVAKREVSNVPTQALVLLNDPMFHEAATALADRVRQAARKDEERLKLAFRIVLSREPADAERAKILQFLNRLQKNIETADEADRAAWELVCSVLLNLDETLTRP